MTDAPPPILYATRYGKRTHAPDREDETRTACGHVTAGAQLSLTEELPTCQWCLRRTQRQREAREAA